MSNTWDNGTQYFALHSTSVGKVLIEELGYRSEFLNVFENI